MSVGSNRLGDNKENTKKGNATMTTTYNARVVNVAEKFVTALVITFSALVLTAGALAITSHASSQAPNGTTRIALGAAPMSSVGGGGAIDFANVPVTSFASTGSGGSLAVDTPTGN